MNNLKIEKTGNFWIDNGIVGLYRILKVLENDDCEITSDGLELSFEDENSLVEALNKARAEVVSKYLKKTGNFGWIYKDGYFHLYPKNSYRPYIAPFFNKPKSNPALVTPDSKDSDAGSKGRKMTKDEYQQFLEFQENEISKHTENKRLKIEKKGFFEAPPVYSMGKTFESSFLEKGKKLCFFSGKTFKRTDVVSGVDYPFLTTQSGELNFSSFLKGKPQISALYSFVALFSFYNLNYLLQDKMKHYFVLYDGDLESLSEFLNTIVLNVEQISRSDWSSFETEFIGTEYESEALFNFLLSVYSQLKSDFEEERVDESKLYTKSVFTLSNDGNIFRNVKEYTSLSSLFNLFESFAFDDKEQSYFKYFINFVRSFSQYLGKDKQGKDKYNNIWREQLCNDILNFNSIARTIESYLGEVKIKEEKGSVPYLDKILIIYNQKTNNKMNADLVKLCQNIGINIGIYSHAEKDRSCLYSLRNAKSRVEFLKALELIQFRIMESEKVPDQFKTKNYLEFFTNLPDGREWEEMKSMVSIFSMNSYLYEKQKTTKAEIK